MDEEEQWADDVEKEVPEWDDPGDLVVAKRDRGIVVSREAAEHPDLSYMALGLLVRILALPDGSETDTKLLASFSHESFGDVQHCLVELATAGLITVHPSSEPN